MRRYATSVDSKAGLRTWSNFVNTEGANGSKTVPQVLGSNGVETSSVTKFVAGFSKSPLPAVSGDAYTPK